jgi:hypothetical protein
MVTIPKIEFYINHTCNLTCNNCNRFNNYNFVGWQNFNDYKSELEQWAELVDVEQLVIMGGEPLLNPSLLDWVDGLNDLWNKDLQILSNGTHLSKTLKLYQRLQRGGNWLGISWHNRNHKDLLLEQINAFLKPPITCSVDMTLELKTGDQIEFFDANGVKIIVWVQDSFGPAAIKTENGKLTLHNNDPEEVHPTCGFVQNKCYHMIEAKLYKCGPVALFPEFDKQHPLNISDEDRQLINSYRPLCVDEFPERGEEFLKHIGDVIPQCKFCPVGWQSEPELIYPHVKGKQ